MRLPCKEWTGARSRAGYGYRRIGKKVYRVHRLAMAEHLGVSIDELDGIHVLHRCDNPPCYEASHLFLGTDADNAADCDAKGRRPRQCGERNGSARLNQEQVHELRLLYGTGVWTQRKLAKRYGVNQSQVSLIVNHKTWRSQCTA